MTKRIFVTTFAIGLVILLLSAALFMGVLYEYFCRQVFRELEHETIYVAQGVESSGASYFDGLDTKNRITWISAEGTVIYDTQAQYADLDNHLNRSEITAALETGSGQSARYSNTLSQRTFYYALRLSDNTVIRVSSTQHTVAVLSLGMLYPLLIIIIIAIVLSAILSAKLAKRIVRPVNSIDLEHPNPNDVYTELTPLLSRINMQNITIKKQMEALQTKQREFTAITENMSEGFILVDRNGTVLSYNTSALRLLDSPPFETLNDFSAGSIKDTFLQTAQTALAGTHSELQIATTGRCRQLIANPVIHDDAIVGAVLLILDVTEKHQLEEMRREFSANVSHELKTPLTAISGFAEIIKNGIAAPEDIPEFAEDIHREANRLLTLISDIIHLSQLDENNISVAKQDIDLYTLAEDTAASLASSASEQNIEIHISGVHGHVSGVHHVLSELLYNLCDNAIKYNKQNGQVDITISEDDKHVTLSVSDTGIGIAPEHQTRVFERFYRVDKSHSRSIGGTGLGLSIVKHAASFHKAELRLKSIPGAGTTVYVIFKRNNS
jgi:two-component system phosphate regulon sensor histidine kinase PhoR